MLSINHGRLQAGKWAEKKACQFLQSKGLSLISANYFCYHGEIDLIMKDKDTIVFVEVRFRKNIDFGHPLETVNNTKMRKIIKAATHYLQKTEQLFTVTSRYDIVAIHLAENSPKIDWVENAFESTC